MKSQITFKKRSLAIVLFVILLISVAIVHAASFSFDPDINGQVLQLSEDSRFFYDVNVTVADSNVTYTSNAGDVGLDSFILKNASGIINFTPPNSEVGLYFITIIATNISSPTDQDTMVIGLNISNVNDPPNITSYFPNQTNLTLAENVSQIFNITATDQDLIYDDALNVSWYLDGNLQSNQFTFNFTPSFCQSGTHNLSVVVNDTSNANDTQNWNLTVNNSNRPPTLNRTILNLSWSEGENRTNNLTLSTFLIDLDFLECADSLNKDTLTYTASGNNSIKVIINQTTANVTFIPNENFFGIQNITFYVNDSTNRTASNTIQVNITNVNDAPTFNMTNQTLYENITFWFDINASDPDNDVISGTDTISYYENSSLFDINTTTGIIQYVPQTSNVGLHVINFSIGDGTVNTSIVVTFNISSNDRPTLNPVGDLNATESVFFLHNVSASDPDTLNLTFTSNFSALVFTRINETKSNFSFTPSNSHVGNNTVNITVTDEHGAQDHEIIQLQVFNQNNEPNLTTIEDQTLRVDRAFSLTVQATDADGESLTFGDNTSLFNIASQSATTGLISLTPTESDIGFHVVNITVQDAESADWQVVTFTVLNNTPPNLTTIGNQTIIEDSRFIFYVNATDDQNDELTFSTNTTLFNLTTFNTSSVIINFTPTQADVGVHVINLTVNDSPLLDYEIFLLNITILNDTPYFDPPIPTLNATVNTQFFYDVNATDEENDVLTFSSNASLFTINDSTGIIDFTPSLDQIGNHTINISVTDGLSSNISTVLLTVFPPISAPNITEFYPNATITLFEGDSQLFNVTVVDIDNSVHNYSWYLNSTLQTNETTFTYSPGFSDAGFYNLTLIIRDGAFNVSNVWNVTVNDTNRAPLYGLINQSTQADFLAGTSYQVNVTANPGNITLLQNGSAYFSSGNFTSEAIDLQTSSNLSFLNLTWTQHSPENTSVIFQLRTSPDNETYTNFTGNTSVNYTNPNGSIIQLSGERYIQYRIILETNNSNTTPTIEDVQINYQIADFYGEEDTVYLRYLDLDDFFSDLDTDNSFTYNASSVDNIDIEIDSQNRVTLTPDADFFGVRTVVFTASDGTDQITSQNITISLADKPEPGSSSTASSGGGGGGGGGGSSTRIVYLNRSVIVNQSKGFELLTPQTITAGLNQEIIVPIEVRNPEESILRGISLSAQSNMSDIQFFLSDEFINQLEEGESQMIDLVVEEIEEPLSFSIRVTGEVEEPALNDSAVISINILGNFSEHVKKVRDFVRLNPECLELDELIVKAENLIGQSEYAKAQTLLESVLDECKQIISGKKFSQDGLQPSYLNAILNSPYLAIAGIILLLILVATAFVFIYNALKWN